MKLLLSLLVKIQFWVATLFLVIFVLAVILQVATRYIPGFAWLWTEQVANYSFIWCIMMGAAIGVRNKQHFFLSILTDRFTPPTAWRVNLFIQSLIGLFGVFLSYYGIVLTKSFWRWSLTALPQISQGYFWMALPTCGMTMAIYAFYNVYEIVGEKPKRISIPGKEVTWSGS
jgi:TRAP-type C4-dicarboxylate transport system permease small subunit